MAEVWGIRGRTPCPQALRAVLVAVMVGPLWAAGSPDAARDQGVPPALARQPARPEIRAFDLATLGALGREMYRHDALAWVATDVLFETVPRATYAAEGGAGWVVETGGEEPLVRFVRGAGGRIEAAYDIVFPREGKPRLVVPENRELSDGQMRAYRAFRTALDALLQRRLPWCGGNPNHVVLPDPDGDGFLVYLLRPKPAPDAVPVGGHYRMTVSADGETLERVDQLFASCLTLSRTRGAEGDGAIAALTLGHVVSPTPLEIHTFLSLQEQLPIYVFTEDGHMWLVGDSAITRTN